MRALSIGFILLATVTLALGARRRAKEYELEIEHDEVNNDGFGRNAVIVNSDTPGPLLSVNKGEDLSIRVENDLSDRSMSLNTSIHCHGILRSRTAYDDGASWVTQCPIQTGDIYTYNVTTGTQAGTFWYHSGFSTQYIDGLRGPLVIYDPDDPAKSLYDVDDKTTVISLTDWYHTSALQLAQDWIAKKIPEPVPDSTLLNGAGHYTGGPKVKMATVKVQQGKRYRLRLINMSASLPFDFSIESHSLTVIEVDGINHHPITVSSLSIAAGQRYSVILNADQAIANYWIAYPSNVRETLTPKANPNYNGTDAFAVLNYKGAKKGNPTTPQITPNKTNSLLEYQLKPLQSPPPPVDEPLVINLTFTSSDAASNPGIDTLGGQSHWLVNGVSYTPPTIPTLVDILDNPNKNNQSDFPPNESVYVLPFNRTIDVRLIGSAGHPFHLHGHAFQVIQSAQGPRNEIDPPMRDTVVTNDGDDTTTPGPVTIRFRTDNPGPWFLYCHKNWHLNAGLAVVFVEAPQEQRNGPFSIQPPRAWQKQCQPKHEA